MAIEIKELEVVMSVSAPEASPMSGPSNPERYPGRLGRDCECNVDQIVAQCVEQVMFILSNQNER